MKKSEKHDKEEKIYIYTTSIDYSANGDKFMIEIYPLERNNNMENEHIYPEKVIHNFDELINFFEKYDQ
jgi:hypothetical protein